MLWIAAHQFAAHLRIQSLPEAGKISGGLYRSLIRGKQMDYERGLPCPNLFAGWHNAHAVTEWACLDDMAYSVAVLVALAEEWTKP